MHTRESLKADAVRLGIEAGDTLFIHSSFKSLDTLGGSPSARDYLSKITSHEDCVYFER
jgi:aminoglycoside N3'-acetyltransferase